ncbi:MAG: PepSY domain-containing protein [Pseudomonadota bacterium]
MALNLIMKAVRTAALFCSAALAFSMGLAGPAQAQSDQDRALRARQSGAVQLPALERMVEQRVGGKVVGRKPIGSGANIGYRFTVLRGADVVTVTVNAKSGAITGIKEPR